MKNRAASIRARLLNLAKNENLDFQLIIIRFLHERFLYRLSKSDYSDQFILKGGAIIYAMQGLKTRPTLDIDLLGKHIANDKETICDTFRKICNTIENDEVLFLAESVTGEIITQTDKYNGVRVFIDSKFDTIRQRLQIDVGFGDIVTPSVQELEYPVLLEDLDAPVLFAYSIETVIAEKFHAMIELSQANSRMKDFYDLYELLTTTNPDIEILRTAIIATFDNHKTLFVNNHSLFTKEFATDFQRQRNWEAFLKKIDRKNNPSFEAVMQIIVNKLRPFWENLSSVK